MPCSDLRDVCWLEDLTRCLFLVEYGADRRKRQGEARTFWQLGKGECFISTYIFRRGTGTLRSRDVIFALAQKRPLDFCKAIAYTIAHDTPAALLKLRKGTVLGGSRPAPRSARGGQGERTATADGLLPKLSRGGVPALHRHSKSSPRGRGRENPRSQPPYPTSCRRVSQR